MITAGKSGSISYQLDLLNSSYIGVPNWDTYDGGEKYDEFYLFNA